MAANNDTFERARFKNWVALSEIREQITKAVEKGNTDQAGSLILAYISTALARPYEDVSWEETATLYVKLVTANLISRPLAFMRISSELKPPAWDYAGRVWYFYVHLLAEKYGWTLDYVAEMDVDDALAMAQEALIDRQLTKEWEWTLSERFVGWDEVAKQSKAIEYPRPDWMKPVPEPVKITKIPKAMLPVGNVVNLNAQTA